ncbi:programmed cell death 1 ligand 1 [Myxocyprinus asiaticus]|uniref:programmed cell death 1 ligand 1 n=1 Tax=Myxocyprinus asiaticus TaxID=70543 RepID=UPI002222C5C2|nr:programmed cell death 1 ligand 1 [Myxocyprinus asiaticus]
MRGTLVFICQALLWPAVSALFTVEVEEREYKAELHSDIKLECRFSTVKRDSDLSVIWRRVEPNPDVDVYRLERGRVNHNYTSAAFKERAQLIQELLDENRAVLHLKKLRIKDSGTYQCIVKYGDEGDYKHVTLNVTAPYTPIKKTVRQTGRDEVELSCETKGYPLPQVIWSDGQNTNLTDRINSTTRSTDEDLINIISKLRVKRDLVNNYTCAFLMKGEMRRTATFSLPDEIPRHCSSQSYAWIGAVVVVLLAIALTSFVLRVRKNDQKGRNNESSKCCFLLLHLSPATNTDSLLTENKNRPDTCKTTLEVTSEKPEALKEVLTQQYSQIITNTQMKSRFASYCANVLPHALYTKEGQSLNIASILPDKRQTILLLGEPGSGKTTVAQIMSSCWVQSITTDPFNIHRLQPVVLVDCSEAQGDFFQVVKSSMTPETPLDECDLKEMLLGPTDCLVILDGYREGNTDLDETLRTFLSERQTCRVLVTSRTGECPALENRVRTVLQLIPRPEEYGS